MCCALFEFIAVRLFKRTKSNTIVLTGLSGSGKTILFYQVSTFGFIDTFLGFYFIQFLCFNFFYCIPD